MNDFWDPLPPSPSDLADHDLPRRSDWLRGKHIALLVCGGIAAFKSPLLARELRRHGAEVTVFVSQEALRYVTPDSLAWSSNQPVIQQLSPRAEHLGDGQHYDAYLLAPATYNTLNKFRHGIADSLLTTVLASALGHLERGETQILVAPTMHGSMHNSLLEASLIHLQELGVTVLPPRDAYGKHNLPDETEIALRTARALSQSPLRGVPILVTGGPTPVPIDAIRRITTRFTGALGQEIATALFVAGAEVHWIHGQSTLTPPSWLPCTVVDSYAAYRDSVLQLIGHTGCRAAIFSAAVADYQPASVYAGKLPSGGELRSLPLVPTAKVIQEVRAAYPDLHLISFKFEAGVSPAQLLEIAQARLQTGSQAVVANRDEDQQGEQQAWLVTPEGAVALTGKPAIARALVAHLEKAGVGDQGPEFVPDADESFWPPLDHHHHSGYNQD